MGATLVPLLDERSALLDERFALLDGRFALLDDVSSGPGPVVLDAVTLDDWLWMARPASPGPPSTAVGVDGQSSPHPTRCSATNKPIEIRP
jgi:hypothetical protein